MKTQQFLALGFTCICVMQAVHAQRIDFETLPGGATPTDQMIISNQFAVAPFGVTFQFEDGTYPQIAKKGPPLTAFKPADTPADGQDCGEYFLTDGVGDGEGVGPPPSKLIITYSQPVEAASGFILDIDNHEQWQVEARGVQTQFVAQVNLQRGAPATGNKLATPWSFQRPSAEIKFIWITYTGTGNPGLAFDNFSPAASIPTPQPAQLSLSVITNAVNLTIAGTPSAVYVVESADTPTATNWTTETSIVLPATNLTLTNLDFTTNAPCRFFRATGLVP